MNTNINCPLKANTISEIVTLPKDITQEQNMSYTLQVIQLKKCESKTSDNTNKENYIIVVRDLNVKYKGFVLQRETKNEEIKENDYITITSISIKMISNTKVFIIKSYNILSNLRGINFNLNEPTFYNENKASQYISQNSNSNLVITPLKQLTTFSRDFTICVRVTQKTDMKYFSNLSTPNGKLFSFNILDKDGSEMQVTCFNKVADKFFNEIEKNQIYEITGGYVKINDKKFSSLKTDYKLVLDDKVEIKKIEDDGKIQKETSNFITISDIPKLQLYSLVDICGVVLEVGEKNIKKTKNGEQPLKKVIVGDISKYKIELSLWRGNANLDINKNDIIYVHHVKIGEFNGRNLTTTDNTFIDINTHCEEVEKMKKFISTYNNEFSALEKIVENGNNIEEVHFSLYYLKDILNDEFIPENNKAITIKGTIVQITHNEKNYYIGCGNVNCKKKLNKKDNSDIYICSGCNTEYQKPTYYYNMNIRIKDASFEYWVDLFGKTAENLIKMTAEDYKDIVMSRDTKKLKQISDDIEFKDYIFHLKSKVQLYAGNAKKRLYATKVESINNTFYYNLIKNIEKKLYH